MNASIAFRRLCLLVQMLKDEKNMHTHILATKRITKNAINVYFLIRGLQCQQRTNGEHKSRNNEVNGPTVQQIFRGKTQFMSREAIFFTFCIFT